MSVFILKIIACLSMFIDHIGIVGFDSWGFIGDSTYKLFRGIGRLAFPLFVFLLVNGWLKTRDRKKYLSRMMVFAFLSQIPYTLALYTVNHYAITSGESLTVFHYSGYWIIQLILLIAYCFKVKRRDISIIWAAISLGIAGLLVKVNGIWIFTNSELNVFYTLALGIILMDSLDAILFHWKKQRWYINLFIIGSTSLSILFIGTRSDYGLMGLILIAALFFLKENKILQAAALCMWGIIFYGVVIGNMYNAVFACMSAIPIIAYNNKKSISLKYFFYLFYPIHLLVLGFVNIMYRLD